MMALAKLAFGAVSGLSLKTWLRIAGAAAVLLLLWMAYSWVWDRGAASKQAEVDHEKAKVVILVDDVARLTKAIAERNALIEANAAQARQASADAAARAGRDLDAVEARRAQERKRGAGAGEINAFMRETFQ